MLSNHRQILGEVYGTESHGKRLVDSRLETLEMVFGFGLSPATVFLRRTATAAGPPRVHGSPISEICQPAFF
jgi:hypothetical protein